MAQEFQSRLPRGIFGLIIAGVLFFVVSFVGVTIDLILEDLGLSEDLAYEIGCSIPVVVALIALGGVKQFLPTREALHATWRDGKSFIIISVVLMCIQLSSLWDGDVLADNWLPAVLEIALLCLFIGVYEEGLFRGIVMSGILSVMPKSRRGQLVAVAIGALLFGAAHISFGDVAWDDPIEAGQAVLKIAQTGVYGFVLGVSALRAKNLMGVSLLHGFDDFLVMFVPYGLLGEAMDTNYVDSGDDGIYTLILYAIMVALYLPSAVRAVRRFAGPSPEAAPAGAAADVAAAPVPPTPGVVPPTTPVVPPTTPAQRHTTQTGVLQNPLQQTQVTPSAAPVPPAGAQTPAATPTAVPAPAPAATQVPAVDPAQSGRPPVPPSISAQAVSEPKQLGSTMGPLPPTRADEQP